MNLPAHIITCHTIHEPTRSWHSISRSKQSIIVSQNNTPGIKEQQRLRLARPTRRQAKLFQTAWRYSLPARRQRPPRPTVSSSPPGGAHRAARRLLSADPLAKAIAWRLSEARQAPYQNNPFLVYDTPVNPVYPFFLLPSLDRIRTPISTLT